MDQDQLHADSLHAPEENMVETPAFDVAVIDSASEPFLGQWHRLVSTTNWQKGRIIHQWRESLLAAGAPSQEYSDEAWSRRAGNVTGQHVGRLRRVYERFHESYEQYNGLFWSHFQAAIEWPDAEMWLEGAVQNDWSISEMRSQRASTLGQVVDAEPKGDADWDEGDDLAEPQGELRQVRDPEERDETPARSVLEDEFAEGAVESAPFDDEPAAAAAEEPAAAAAEEPAVRPFENLAELPPDLADAFESYKLAILRHKMSEWREISRADVLASLEALKQLVTA